MIDWYKLDMREKDLLARKCCKDIQQPTEFAPSTGLHFVLKVIQIILWMRSHRLI